MCLCVCVCERVHYLPHLNRTIRFQFGLGVVSERGLTVSPTQTHVNTLLAIREEGDNDTLTQMLTRETADPP